MSVLKISPTICVCLNPSFFKMCACGIKKIGPVFIILCVYILVSNIDAHQLAIAVKMKSCTSCALPSQSAGAMLLGLKRGFITREVCVGVC